MNGNKFGWMSFLTVPVTFVIIVIVDLYSTWHRMHSHRKNDDLISVLS